MYHVQHGALSREVGGDGGAGDGVLQGVQYVVDSHVAVRWRVPAIALDSL